MSRWVIYTERPCCLRPNAVSHPPVDCIRVSAASCLDALEGVSLIRLAVGKVGADLADVDLSSPTRVVPEMHPRCRSPTMNDLDVRGHVDLTAGIDVLGHAEDTA